jgi:hypothetical protein
MVIGGSEIAREGAIPDTAYFALTETTEFNTGAL